MSETARLTPREDYVKVLEMRQRTAAPSANATPKFVLLTHESIITTPLTDADTLFREGDKNVCLAFYSTTRSRKAKKKDQSFDS